MPIAQASSNIGSGAYVVIPGVIAGEPLTPGLAVAITPAGVLRCSASTFGESFVGFTLAAVATGEPVAVLSMRGSAVTPVVEGGGLLIAGQPVYLSNTLGKVTQTALNGSNQISIQVGVSISTTQLTLLTDLRVRLLG